VTLAESFAFVASEEEWGTFRSFGPVTGVERWIASYAACPGKPGKLDEYERLRPAFLRRVHKRLRSGEWIGEGFDPAQGPDLLLIPRHLWRSLDFDSYEDEVSGAGFRFVSLLMSSGPDQESLHVARTHTGKIPLSQILGCVATPDEAAEYAELKPYAGPIIIVLGAPVSQRERDHWRCRELQEKLWARALPRLLSGEWVAEGFTKGALQRTRITTEILPELRCDFSSDEIYSEPELALHFYRVLIDTTPVAKPRPNPGTSRRRLKDWLGKLATSERELVRKGRLLEEARAALSDTSITNNMLEECLRETGTSRALLFTGRPPK
jgi:hypothetical protein